MKLRDDAPAGLRGADPPKIFYCTRTHAQVKQAVRELAGLPYSPHIAILGSRKQLCACKSQLKRDNPLMPLGISCMQKLRRVSPHGDGAGGMQAPAGAGSGCSYYEG